MYAAVSVTPREALLHVPSFVGLFHFVESTGDDIIAPLEPVAGAEAGAEAKLIRRKRSVWMPNPSAAIESELRSEDPKKAYSIQGEIGHGGFGSVKLGVFFRVVFRFARVVVCVCSDTDAARMRNGDAPVAIKIINKSLTEARAAILAEVQIMKMCNHRHIVDLVDALVWKDVCYLVMRYCEPTPFCVLFCACVRAWCCAMPDCGVSGDGGSLEMLVDAVTLTDPQVRTRSRSVSDERF